MSRQACIRQSGAHDDRPCAARPGAPFPGRGRESGEQAADVDIDSGPGGSPRRVDAALNTDLDRKRTGPGCFVSAGGRLPSFRRGAVCEFALECRWNSRLVTYASTLNRDGKR